VLRQLVPLAQIDELGTMPSKELRCRDKSNELAAENSGSPEDIGNARDPALAIRRSNDRGLGA
jgi:hypothetical protein